MTPATIREMIECAAPAEKRQMKAWINVELDLMRNVRKAMAEGRQKLELGIEQETNDAECKRPQKQ